jgi:hypothetical protein
MVLYYYSSMSVNTKVASGVIHNLDLKTTLLDITIPKMEVNYNPGLCRDDKGQLWISIRSCIHNPERYKGYEHPVHYQNYLHVGKLNEETLEVTELKEIKPEAEYTGFQWGIEDVRLFWREDGLHGIGVILPILENGPYARQAEILINHKTGTYKLLKDYGNPMGSLEKNWSPPEKPARLFDFVYSPTQIVMEGAVIGEPNDLFIHNGSPLLEYEDGFISIAHVVTGVKRLRTYITLAVKWDKAGHATHISQFFQFDVGWREKLQETIEFASSAVWASGKEGKELLIGLGVKDELVGISRLPVEKLEWQPYADTLWYGWDHTFEPNRKEIPNTPDKSGLWSKKAKLA